MSVVGTDMNLKYSVAAAAGNTTAGTAATSLGDQVSTTQLSTSGAGTTFDDVTPSEASAGSTEYRCFFVCNDHATDSAAAVSIAVQSEIALGGAVTIALDNIGVTAKGSASAQAATVASETTAPTGVGTYGAGPLTIGTMAAGTVAAFWVKRIVGASTAAITADGATFRIAGQG